MKLFDMLAKILLFCAAVYLIMLAFALDVTGWLASAGIVGIAVGFAAKDSLANLFAGIFIIADAPYKLGDFIMFEDGMRGRVTEIGLRATRILTRDDIEINIPNQLIGLRRRHRPRAQGPARVPKGPGLHLRGAPPARPVPEVRRLGPRVLTVRVDPRSAPQG